MKRLLGATAILLGSATLAAAEGELFLYNWGNYTSPELIEKFEQQYDVDVTITDFDSNDTALAKIKAGAHGFDIVVPSAQTIPIWVAEGLLLEVRPDQMENFKHVDPRWVDVQFDPGRHYTVPWQWGVTGVAVNTDHYQGDIDTWRVIFEPPPELAGKVNVVPEMLDILAGAVMYIGGRPCTTDKEAWRRARDLFVAAKPSWIAMNYETTDALPKGDFLATAGWNGPALRARLKNPAIKFGFPKEGFPIWMDNVAILKDAQNVENAKLFMNFVMAPENAAMISNFAKYSNGIKGSEQFMVPEMQGAPELTLPEGHKGVFLQACPPEVNQIMTRIWTEDVWARRRTPGRR
jgi:spermidine/putrescine transport system substrate-binding protein